MNLTLLRANLFRAFCSLRFLGCVLAAVFLLYGSVAGILALENDVVSYLALSLSGSGISVVLFCILPLLPFAASFANDMNENSVLYWTSRTGIVSYAVNKFLAALISGFAVPFLGILLFAGSLRFSHPLFLMVSSGDAYASLLTQNQPVRYILCFVTHYGLSGMLLAALSFGISVFITDPFAALAAPTAIYFLLLRFLETAPIPEMFKMTALVDGIWDQGSPARTLGAKFLSVAILCFLIGMISLWRIRRRMKNV